MNWHSFPLIICTNSLLIGLLVQIGNYEFSEGTVTYTKPSNQKIVASPPKSQSAPSNIAIPTVSPKQRENTGIPVPVPETARLITVKVLSGDSSGSGILIQRQGENYIVITNDHVLHKGDKYKIQTHDGHLYSASVYTVPFTPAFTPTVTPSEEKKTRSSTSRMSSAYRGSVVNEILSSYLIYSKEKNNKNFDGNDLGLLEFCSPNLTYTVADFASALNLKVGDEVFASGFPTESDDSKSIGFVFTHGKVSLVSEKALEGGYQLGYTNNIQKGMSGGPVLNSQGQVVAINGMHAYPLWGDPYIYIDGSKPSPTIKQKMISSSWAIPIETFKKVAPEVIVKQIWH